MDKAITLHIIKFYGAHTPRRPAVQSYMESSRCGEEYYSIDTNGFMAAFAELMQQRLTIEEANCLLVTYCEQQCRNARNQNCVFVFYPPNDIEP